MKDVTPNPHTTCDRVSHDVVNVSVRLTPMPATSASGPLRGQLRGKPEQSGATAQDIVERTRKRREQQKLFPRAGGIHHFKGEVAHGTVALVYFGAKGCILAETQHQGLLSAQIAGPHAAKSLFN
jgi:hypothetical protein